MDEQTRTELKAFTGWLISSRWLRPEALGRYGLKFNPNHDPANGRFANGGGSYGGGGASNSRRGVTRPQSDWAMRSGTAVQRTPSARPSASSSVAPGAAQSSAKPQLRHVISNGYDYAIDTEGRTRTVSGDLTLNPDNPRSRSAQAAAGGPDRLPTDDGGHYIAARFDGPTEAFNHFAQDSNVNRGRYRALEDQWARAKRAGKDVYVRIAPSLDGPSQRPSALNVWFTIDGDEKSVKLPN